MVPAEQYSECGPQLWSDEARLGHKHLPGTMSDPHTSQWTSMVMGKFYHHGEMRKTGTAQSFTTQNLFHLGACDG